MPLSLSIPDSTLNELADLLADKIIERLAARGFGGDGSVGGSEFSTFNPSFDRTRLYREPEAAKLLNIALHTLRRLRQTGEVKASYTRRPVRYSWEDLEEVKRVMRGGKKG